MQECEGDEGNGSACGICSTQVTLGGIDPPWRKMAQEGGAVDEVE